MRPCVVSGGVKSAKEPATVGHVTYAYWCPRHKQFHTCGRNGGFGMTPGAPLYFWASKLGEWVRLDDPPTAE